MNHHRTSARVNPPPARSAQAEKRSIGVVIEASVVGGLLALAWLDALRFWIVTAWRWVVALIG